MPEYVVCNLCGQNRTQIIQKADPPYQVVKCLNCGLVYTNPQPDQKDIEAHYKETYYRDWIDKQMTRRKRMWTKRLRDIRNIKKSGRLLDVGCGIGTFLNLAQDSGYAIRGTEISEYGSKYVKKQLNIEVFKGDVKEAQFPSDYFDIITLWHTLEHLPHPLSDLREIHRILAPTGLIVIAVPNVNNYITRFFYLIARRKSLKLFSTDAKEWHFYHFSLRTLRALMEKAGFCLIRTEQDLAQIEFSKKIVDFIAWIVHKVTGKNFGEGLKVYAVKS